MATLCAQYNLELTFDDYVEGSPIDHTVLENEIRTAIQNRLDELMLTGTRRNPLVPTMYVTNVAFETDYPHPDSQPSDVLDFETKHWIAHLKKVDGLSLSQLTDQAYVTERISITLRNEGAVLDADEICTIGRDVVAHVKATC